jgi:hypothetical protein
MLFYSFFAYYAFKFFLHFQKKEDEFRAGFLGKVASLKKHHRQKLLDPFLLPVFRDFFNDGSNSYFRSLMAKLYIEKPGKGRSEYIKILDENNEQINLEKELSPLIFEDILDEQIKPDGQGKTSVERYIFQNEYVRFIENLDNQYEKLNFFSKCYYNMEKYCYWTSYTTLALCISFLLGFVRLLIEVPILIIYFWSFLVFQLLIVFIISFLLMEVNRRKFLKDWESLEIYGQI